MSNLKLLPLLLIIFAVTSRLLPHPPNFAPIAAVALFGAVYLPKKYAFILPVVAMLISDFIIGFYGQTMLFVYFSFALTALIGLWVRNHKSIAAVLGSSLIASVLFFLITNFGVWADPRSWYPKDFSGLLQSYAAGVPFFRYTFLGDLFYTLTLFGSYELLVRVARKYLSANLFQKIA